MNLRGNIDQRNAGRSGELRVRPEHVDREGNFVDHALAGWLSFGPKLQIGRIVVQSIAVLVVDILLWQKRAAEFFCHHLSVLIQFLSAAQIKSAVAGRVDVPLRRDRSPFSALVSAFSGAEFLSVIVSKSLSVRHSEASPHNDPLATWASECRRLYELVFSGALQRAESMIRPASAWLEFLAAFYAVFHQRRPMNGKFGTGPVYLVLTP